MFENGFLESVNDVSCLVDKFLITLIGVCGFNILPLSHSFAFHSSPNTILRIGIDGRPNRLLAKACLLAVNILRSFLPGTRSFEVPKTQNKPKPKPKIMKYEMIHPLIAKLLIY